MLYLYSVSDFPLMYGIQNDSTSNDGIPSYCNDADDTCRINLKVAPVSSIKRLKYTWYMKCKKAIPTTDFKGKGFAAILTLMEADPDEVVKHCNLGLVNCMIGSNANADGMYEILNFKFRIKMYYTFTFSGRVAELGSTGCKALNPTFKMIEESECEKRKDAVM